MYLRPVLSAFSCLLLAHCSSAHLGSKTTYLHSKTTFRDEHQEGTIEWPFPYTPYGSDSLNDCHGDSHLRDCPLVEEKCTPIYTTRVYRHGIRGPGSTDLKKIQHLYDKIFHLRETDDSGMNDIMKALKDWQIGFDPNFEKMISQSGQKEQFELGQELGRTLKFMWRPPNAGGVRFASSHKPRAKDSAIAFFNGLRSELMFLPEEKEILEDDNTLYFFGRCKKFGDEVSENKTAGGEKKAFVNGPEFWETVERVREKLQGLEDLSPGDVENAYKICGVEKAVFGASPWCLLFSPEDKDALQYSNDLKHYWKRAYGYEINYAQSCPLLSELLNNLVSAANNHTTGAQYTPASLYFGHAETLLPLYARLGLFRDSVPLRSDTYDQLKKRQFRSTHLVPFSANIEFLLLACDSDKVDDSEGEETPPATYKVMARVNGRPVLLPFSGDALLPLSGLLDWYKDTVGTCRFDDICGNKRGNGHDEL